MYNQFLRQLWTGMSTNANAIPVRGVTDAGLDLLRYIRELVFAARHAASSWHAKGCTNKLDKCDSTNRNVIQGPCDGEAGHLFTIWYPEVSKICFPHIEQIPFLNAQPWQYFA